jgi:hypothetical protein
MFPSQYNSFTVELTHSIYETNLKGDLKMLTIKIGKREEDPPIPRLNIGQVLLPNTMENLLMRKRISTKCYCHANVLIFPCSNIGADELPLFIAANALDICQVEEEVEIISKDVAFNRNDFFTELETRLGVRLYGI